MAACRSRSSDPHSPLSSADTTLATIRDADVFARRMGSWALALLWGIDADGRCRTRCACWGGGPGASPPHHGTRHGARGRGGAGRRARLRSAHGARMPPEGQDPQRRHRRRALARGRERVRRFHLDDRRPARGPPLATPRLRSLIELGSFCALPSDRSVVRQGASESPRFRRISRSRSPSEASVLRSSMPTFTGSPSHA